MVPTARPASASVRESPLARGPIGHATDSTTQCNSCAKPATITGIRYDFCSLYPGRNIPLRKFEDACRPRSTLLWQGKLCPNIKVFGVLRADYGRFRACLNDYSDQFRSKRAEIDPPHPRCALHHSAVISLNFVIGSIGTSPGFAPLRNLSTRGRHGVARQESPPYPVSPPLAGDSSDAIAASEPFVSRRADRLHPSEFAPHRLRPTQPAARHGWRALASAISAPARPRRYATKHHHELPPSHSITLSALASSVSGTVSPSAFAVLRLTDSSNLEA